MKVCLSVETCQFLACHIVRRAVCPSPGLTACTSACLTLCTIRRRWACPTFGGDHCHSVTAPLNEPCFGPCPETAPNTLAGPVPPAAGVGHTFPVPPPRPSAQPTPPPLFWHRGRPVQCCGAGSPKANHCRGSRRR